MGEYNEFSFECTEFEMLIKHPDGFVMSCGYTD